MERASANGVAHGRRRCVYFMDAAQRSRAADGRPMPLK
jgi:hypothetical protein